MIFAHITRSLRDTFPGRASEWALGFMLFGWAVILAANPDLFTEGMGYRGLAAVFHQQVWMWLCLVVGGGRLIVLAINGAWRRSPHLRGTAAFISCFFWFEVTVGIIQTGLVNTGLAIYPVLFLLDAFNAIRAMGEAGLSDRIHGRGKKHGTDP